MTARARIAVVLLVFAQGMAGCGDEPRSRPLPVAPTPITPPPAPQPPPSHEGYTLSPSPEIVAPEGELSVIWNAPTGGKWDWIAIFTVGAPNCHYALDWYWYTNGESSGTLTLKAPKQPGQYEFRYHLNDGCEETVRSSPVTVGAGM